MRSFVRAVLHGLLGPVEPYHVLRLDLNSKPAAAAPDDVSLVELSGDDLARCPDDTLREQAWYGGDSSACLGWLHEGQLAAVCVYWWGPRYRLRNFWPLAEGQAKLVQIITAPRFRGLGIAPRLIRASASRMQARGFVRLYARVWHSNAPSLSAFRAAGWARVATVVRCTPRWWPRPLRITWGQRPDGASAAL